MPPQTNALLTAIRSSTAATGGRDDWDDPAVEPAGAGAAKWSGRARVYYREATALVTGDGTATRVPTRTVYLDTSLAFDAGVDADDVLELELDTGATVTAAAFAVAAASMPGIPAELCTTRVELAP